MRRGTCGTFDVEAASKGADGSGWCQKDVGHAPPHDFGSTPEDKAGVADFGAAVTEARDLIEAGKAPLPCGHEARHLIGWTYAATGATETRCGACIEARGRVVHPAVPSRAFSPHGHTSEQIATAAGVAARELCAEHEPGAGAVVEVRLVRRGGGAP